MLSEQKVVWQAHASLLSHNAILNKSSIALMPACLKAFTVNPGFAVNTRFQW